MIEKDLTVSNYLPNQAGRVRCAIYARYSSDNQRKSSIEDQVRNCREAAGRKGWVVLDSAIYIDVEKSGTTLFGRDGLQAAVAAAKLKPRPFEYILIDDSSRLGRNKADVFKTVDILKFHGVHLYFCEDMLDSAESWFEQAFHFKAQIDQEYSRSLGQKIKRGRRGRYLAGFNPGGTCYGYKNIPVEDFTRKGEYGRPAVIGVNQVIDPEEAAVVVRMFEAYASGLSLKHICTMFNREKIPTSQRARTRANPSWCKTAIKEMLRNKRYIGQTTWGCTTQVRDPETGKCITRPVDEEQWERRERPDLRFISDDLWRAVEEQFIRATRGCGVKRLGGMTRTEASRKFLFSGLLKCGLCGGNMTITSTRPARYGCANHRLKSTCLNKVTISLEVLESEFLSALGANLQDLETREHLIQSLFEYLTANRTRLVGGADQQAKQKAELEEARQVLTTQQGNLVRAVRESGHSRALLSDLAEVEGRLSRITETLAHMSAPPPTPIKKAEVREFVESNAHAFLEILRGSPEALRHYLQQRITSITLTPDSVERGALYRVSGDVGLFSGDEDVLQSNQVDAIALQYTIPINFELASGTRAGDHVIGPILVDVEPYSPEEHGADVTEMLARGCRRYMRIDRSHLLAGVSETRVESVRKPIFGGLKLALAIPDTTASLARCA